MLLKLEEIPKQIESSPKMGLFLPEVRVATAQGKQGIWFLLFPDRENTGNLPKNIKNMILHREFTFNTENFEVSKIKC